MKEELERLYLLQRVNMKYSQWAQETPLIKRVEYIKEEVDEAIEEVKNEEWDKFKDEIGDVLWDTLGTIAKAEHMQLIRMQDVLEHIYHKFTQRKPFLLEEKPTSREEEIRVWNEIKAKQKQGQ